MQMKQLSKDDESICYEKYKDYSQIYENVYNCLFEEEYKTIKNNISKKTTGTSNIEEHSSLNTNNFVSPINFNDTKENRNKVIAFIKQCVKTTYCKSEDKCNPITLRIMEKANLNSFKNIMNPKSIDIMKKTISIYCHSLPCCQYITIEMMYNQMLESENSKLEW